jgi:hypothetical protein
VSAGAPPAGDGAPPTVHDHETRSAPGSPGGAPPDHHAGVPANPDHLAEEQPDQPLDPATRVELAGQLTAAREVALRYPTVAEATADGFVLAGGFSPGAGAHYVKIFGDYVNQFDAANPSTLIYDGTSPTSGVVGVMYTGFGVDAAPEGFAGPNDHWHRHRNVCVRYGAGGIEVPFPADRDVTRAMCDDAGGQFMETTTWMVHAWVVPSWESPEGVFSHDNPNVRCADGTMDTDAAGFCQGT